MNKEFEPFGIEWQAEMRRFTKEGLIDFLRTALIKKEQYANDARVDELGKAQEIVSDIEDYDCGLLSGYGGGVVDWWHG